MKKDLIIQCDEYSTYIRCITEQDIEYLRLWKNKHKEAFFFREEITSDMQKTWYNQYLSRKDDYMFAVMCDDSIAGCMAFRERADFIDLYNIIRGMDNSRAKMYEAMYVMLNYITCNYSDKEIRCDVIKGNKAKEWYEQLGFKVLEDNDYYVMGIDKKDIPHLSLSFGERRLMIDD